MSYERSIQYHHVPEFLESIQKAAEAGVIDLSRPQLSKVQLLRSFSLDRVSKLQTMNVNDPSLSEKDLFVLYCIREFENTLLFSSTISYLHEWVDEISSLLQKKHPHLNWSYLVELFIEQKPGMRKSLKKDHKTKMKKEAQRKVILSIFSSYSDLISHYMNTHMRLPYSDKKMIYETQLVDENELPLYTLSQREDMFLPNNPFLESIQTFFNENYELLSDGDKVLLTKMTQFFITRNVFPEEKNSELTFLYFSDILSDIHTEVPYVSETFNHFEITKVDIAELLILRHALNQPSPFDGVSLLETNQQYFGEKISAKKTPLLTRNSAELSYENWPPEWKAFFFHAHIFSIIHFLDALHEDKPLVLGNPDVICTVPTALSHQYGMKPHCYPKLPANSEKLEVEGTDKSYREFVIKELGIKGQDPGGKVEITPFNTLLVHPTDLYTLRDSLIT